MVRLEGKASNFSDCDIIFSGLDADVAGDIGLYFYTMFQSAIWRHLANSSAELQFLRSNLLAFSNAQNHRQTPCIPLAVATVNLSHINVIHHQRKLYYLEKGFLICDSNCAVIGLVVPLAALQKGFPVDQVSRCYNASCLWCRLGSAA
jgi:aspartate-semialdehyde dehydrogenase